MKRIFNLLAIAMLAISASAENIKVQFFTPSIVRIVKGNPSDDFKSEVITATPQQVKIKKTVKGNVSLYSSSALRVEVDEANGRVTFSDKKGQQLLSEGNYNFTPITDGPDKGAFRVKQAFLLDNDEPIYGLGLLQNGKMDQSGENRLMMQSNLEDYASFFQSIKGYGIYWENYSPTQIDDSKTNGKRCLSLESQVGKRVDYYFMYGTDADGVIAQMRYLSGKVPMLPLWTYGFHQSRERYKSQEELLEVVNKYRKLQIPFDGIIQDWQYWGSNYNWNSMDFLNPEFGKPQKMIDEVHRLNAHMSISIWASFGPETKQFKELKSKNLLMDFITWPQSGLPQWPPRMDYPSGVRCYDAYSKDARDIFWKYLRPMHDMGIDAWWMDSTDPDHHNYKESDLDINTAMGSWRSVRNIYPLKTVEGVYDSQRAIDDSKRVFILTRSYFAGQQRTGANTWSGDITSSWESFRNQIPICLNYTLTANPNVNTDIGGFFAGRFNKKGSNSGTSNPQFQELYTRWMQFGAFCPMMRSHGTEVYREIYYFGKQGQPVFDALRDAIKLRYKFIPYIYSTSWQVSKNDDSFMRALMMDFKNDRNTWNNAREYMFGRSLLVCPVIDPLYTPEELKKDVDAPDWTATKTYSVYLPAGAKWYDYWTNKLLDGGQTIQAEITLAHSPLYVKAGSIIPQGPDVQYTSEQKWDNLNIVIYPGADAEFTLYEDEGDNYNYEKGEYSEICMKWNDRSHTLTILPRKGTFTGMLSQRTFNISMVGQNAKPVNYTGKQVRMKM